MSKELIAFILCLALLAFLIWKEATRNNRSHRPIRILCAVVAVICLFFISNPVYFNPGTLYSSGAILLTEGVNIDSVTAFKKTTHKEFRIFSLNEQIAAKYNATFITDEYELEKRKIDTLYIFGNGVNQDEIKNQPIVFRPSPLPAGVTDVYWNRKIPLGGNLTIRGRFHNNFPHVVKLILSGYGVTLDTVMIPAGEHPFSLTTSPKQLGRIIYSLTATSKTDTIEKEPVPLETFQAAPTKILLLASSPDFENKFLQNWLAEKGYPVITRTTISKNKTAKTFLNTNTSGIEHITTEILNRFDITIADAGALASLSGDELQSLQTAITKNGKGLIVRADSTLSKKLFFADLFPLIAADTSIQHETSLLIANDTTGRSLVAPSSFYIKDPGATVPLIRDKQGHVFTGHTLFGSGNIITTTLLNTFSWMLSGKKESYDNVWSELITKASPSLPTNETWATMPFLPRKNERVFISLETDSSSHPTAQINGTTVFLSEHPELAFRFNGFYWPQSTGWQTGIQLNGAPFYWYVFENSDWKNVAAAAKEKATTQLSLSKTERSYTIGVTDPVEVSLKRSNAMKFVLWLFFLAACGYLWFENKYYNS